MKKSCLIIALLFAITTVGWANLLANPGFEQGATSWTTAGISQNDWARRSGTNAFVMGAWTTPPGSFSQEVAVPTGTYTFTIWVTRETNTPLTALDLRLDWLDLGGSSLDIPSVSNHVTFPKDSQWHQIHVTGSCTNSNLNRVRVSVTSAWTVASGAGTSVMYDDADLYSGNYAGSRVANGSFESFGSWRNAQWNGSRDLWGDADGGYHGQDWANHSGTRGVAFFSFVTNQPLSNWTVRIWQNVNPVQGTGTYTYALWLNQETNAFFSNAVMTIEWYDSTFTNKVQADSVSNLVVQRDWAWHEHFVQGVCTSPSLFEARVVFSADWSTQPLNGAGRATKLDDVRFVSGAYTTNTLKTDWIYHAAPGSDATRELVPGTNGFGPFMAVNFVTHTNTFYLLTDTAPMATYPEEDACVQVRTAWQVPGTTTWVEAYSTMEKVATVDIATTNAFHGLPAVGNQQVAVWRCYWEQPRNPISGVFYSNTLITVYYTPFIKITNGIIQTDYKYATRLADATTVTNNLGQFLGDTYSSVDYYYLNYIGTPLGAFTNGGFENPTGAVAVLGLDGSGWVGDSNLMERANWGTRSGARALLFYAWNPGSARVLQDVVTTGGVFSFSSYVKVEAGVTNLTALSLRMEWYAANGVLVQVNEESLLDIVRDFNWHAASVVGSCLETNLSYVRLSIQGAYGPSDVVGEAIMFDDAQFLEVSAQVRNADFENPLDGSGWFYEGNCGRQDWGRVPWTNVLGFHGWNPGTAHAYQDVATTGGVLKFSTWTKLEPGATNVSDLSIHMEWYNGDGVLVQTNAKSLLDMPRTYEWEEVYVVGACQEPGITYVRIVFDGNWGASTHAASKSAMFDDVQVVAVSTNLLNVGFETGWGDSTPDWYSWSKELARIESWANQTGTNGVSFRTWIRNAWLMSRYETTLEQPIAVTPGKYAFSVWLKREAAATLTNAELRIEWYGGDYPNKIQADTVLPLTIATAGVWSNYTVTGECANVGLRIAKPVLFAQWDTAANDSLMIDNAAFTVVTAETTDGIPNSWWDLYPAIPVGQRIALGDYDNDGYLNIEEYAGLTDPSDEYSVFPGVTNAPGSGIVMVLVVNPSSSARVYDAWWKTNLLDPSAWQSYGLSVTGNEGLITLTVTNDIDKRFFRSGAKLP